MQHCSCKAGLWRFQQQLQQQAAAAQRMLSVSCRSIKQLWMLPMHRLCQQLQSNGLCSHCLTNSSMQAVAAAAESVHQSSSSSSRAARGEGLPLCPLLLLLVPLVLLVLGQLPGVQSSCCCHPAACAAMLLGSFAQAVVPQLVQQSHKNTSSS
jgi:hypothetical protein